MKKLINDPERLVAESLEGFALAHHDLVEVHLAPDYVVRRGAPVGDKVALLSGGGSGHEPLHAGYVGRGMLDGACPGPVFTSPTPDQILACTRRVDGGRGVVHVVKNYTGDVMNFEIAAELAGAEGIRVEPVVIDDDVAVQDSTYTAGRRGVGATVLAERLAGARAEEGGSLEEVAGIVRRVNAEARSMGMALTSCVVPSAGRPTFDLGPEEMEVGIGIHGEPGRRRLPLEPADRIVDMLMDPVLDDLPFRSGDRVLVLCNGMGGTPLIELYVVMRAVGRVLSDRGMGLALSLVGNHITSLEMAGCSVTLLRLDPELERLWDAPLHTPALRWGV
ncbi:MAG TPA: dihydroxyacetone kinase subunit DhaK [Candidatus Dormibacteraeota bacterium]|jgi:dihydroxyacetone kinase-like protein|nr:dihydroxyacetone kinase subunit DhaK [Candidatus Dormibacteraeota bacterium]